MEANTEIATLGGGCFWCVEAVFLELAGVLKVESGYMGGHIENPTYRQVCGGNTGHAEVIQVMFDPAILRYEDILDVFFTSHDPTTLNRQGADVGTQYRSVIFTHTHEQDEIARKKIAELNQLQVYPQPIVTQVVPAEKFYKAEDYHQDYYRLNPEQGYCQVVIAPKVAKIRKRFVDRLRRA